MTTETIATGTDTKIETPNEGIGTRNFRNVPDIENFYRFVNENNLRHEAKVLLKTILESVKKATKLEKKKEAKALKAAKKALKH